MINLLQRNEEKKKRYSRFERSLIAACFVTGAAAVCECIAVIENAAKFSWEQMGMNGYAGKVLTCLLLIVSFIYLTQAAFGGKAFADRFAAGMRVNGILCILASAVFCLLPGYQEEWFAWKLGTYIRIDGYYFLLGVILILIGYVVKYAVEEIR
ncbi:MAG TPA: hypothetical protein DCZ20_05170 [Lachnospiraceae bacterium]|nr:hypothetical protein [Lachnospiraceae bacterium]